MSILMRSITALSTVLALSACSTSNTNITQGYAAFYAEPLCQFTVFEGKTFDSKNKIKVCMKSEMGQNYMEFNFNTAGQLAQRPLRVKAGQVVWEHVDTANSVHDKLTVSENNSGITVMRLIQGGILSGKLNVREGGKEKIYILDPSSVMLKVTHDGHALTDYDVVPSIKNTNRMNLGRALAPE